MEQEQVIREVGVEIQTLHSEISSLEWDRTTAEHAVQRARSRAWRTIGSGRPAAKSALEQAEASLAEIESQIGARRLAKAQAELRRDELEGPLREARQQLYRWNDRIRDKRTQIDALWRVLSDCEKQCLIRTSSVPTRAPPPDPLDPDNVDLAHDAADVFGSRPRPPYLPGSVGYPPAPPESGVPGPQVGDVLDVVGGWRPSHEPETPQATTPVEPPDAEPEEKSQNPCEE